MEKRDLERKKAEEEANKPAFVDGGTGTADGGTGVQIDQAKAKEEEVPDLTPISQPQLKKQPSNTYKPPDMNEEDYLKFLAEAYGGADQQLIMDQIGKEGPVMYQDNGCQPD